MNWHLITSSEEFEICFPFSFLSLSCSTSNSTEKIRIIFGIFEKLNDEKENNFILKLSSTMRLLCQPLPLLLASIATIRASSHLQVYPKPVNLTAVDSQSNAVKLSWNIDSSSSKVTKDVRSQFHTIQYRREIEGAIDGDENPLSWVDHSMPISIVSRLPTPEIQEITTLVDEGSSISSGQFWLKLDIQGSGGSDLPYHKLESYTVTDPIAFDASTDEFEKAVLNIQGIAKVRVFRYEVGNYGTSILPSRGRYSWRVEFDVDSNLAAHGLVPLFEIYKETLDGNYSLDYKRIAIRRLVKRGPIEYESSLVATVGNLDAATRYGFRVGNGNGKWSQILKVKTKPPSTILHTDKASTTHKNSKHIKRKSGEGRRAGNHEDPDYISPVGTGGFDGHDGSDGLVIIIPQGDNEIITPSRTLFYYSGDVQHYIVGNPNGSSVDVNKEATLFIDIKVWGGGGSGGGSPLAKGSK